MVLKLHDSYLGYFFQSKTKRRQTAKTACVYISQVVRVRCNYVNSLNCFVFPVLPLFSFYYYCCLVLLVMSCHAMSSDSEGRRSRTRV